MRRIDDLDRAIRSGNKGAVAQALLAAWPWVEAAELEVPFAALFARPLMSFRLDGEAGVLAVEIGLLSEDYELAAIALASLSEAPLRLARLAAIARGLPPAEPFGQASSLEMAINSVFLNEPALRAGGLSAEGAARLREGRLGEEILRTLVRVGAGQDPRLLAEGLALLRHVGLEDIARRAALQALLLERRG